MLWDEMPYSVHGAGTVRDVMSLCEVTLISAVLTGYNLPKYAIFHVGDSSTVAVVPFVTKVIDLSDAEHCTGNSPQCRHKATSWRMALVHCITGQLTMVPIHRLTQLR